MTTSWTAVIITASPDLADSIGSFLLDHGAPGLMTEDLDAAVRITAHFAGAAPLDAIERYCRAAAEDLPGAAQPDVRTESVAETAWAENWKDHFPPQSIGERLFIHPPWVHDVPNGRHGILIDPGMAFGTGHHASTRGCLVLLERAMAARPAARVFDLGTGSGILAIAAAKLGAPEIWAVDIDPDACRVAAENTAANGVDAAIRILDSWEGVPGTFDIVLANLFAPQLVEFAPRIVAALRPGGVAIGSGLLLDEETAVVRAWTACGLAPHDRYEDERWVTIAYRKAVE